MTSSALASPLFDTTIQQALYSPGAVANWFLSKAISMGKPIDHMQLQKMMYFAHGWNLARHNAPLVKEHAEAWEYGPVFPSVYHEYKKYGSAPFPLGQSILMEELEHNPNNPNNLAFQKHIVGSEDTRTINILEYVWNTYSGFSGTELSDMTHKPDKSNPWTIFRDIANRFNMQSTDIPNGFIKSYFTTLAAKSLTF